MVQEVGWTKELHINVEHLNIIQRSLEQTIDLLKLIGITMDARTSPLRIHLALINLNCAIAYLVDLKERE